MKIKHLLIILFSSAYILGQSQTCPSCVVDPSVHTNLGPEQAGLVPDVFTVQAGEDTTFSAQYLFPTNVQASGFNATVTSIQILDVVSLPPATQLTWLCDQPGTNCTYDPRVYRFGCVQLCIFTLAPAGTYTINVRVNGCGSAAGISQCQIQNVPITLNVLPPAGNPFFTASATTGCDSLTVNFEETVPNLGPIFPQSFEWNLGTGSLIPGRTATGSFVGEGEYQVALIETVEEFFISAASLTATNTACYCGDVEEPNWPLVGCTASPEPYLIINAGGTDVRLNNNSGDGSNTSTWNNINIPLETNALSIQAWEEDNGPPFGSADDNLGSTLVVFNNTPQTGTFNFSTSFGGQNCANGTYTLSRRVKTTNTYLDTITIQAPSLVPVITNLGNDVICTGDTTVLESSASGSYQWFLNDTTALFGETNRTLVVRDAGNYSVRVTDVGTICSEFSASYEVQTENIPTPVININPATNNLYVNNPNGYAVQWFTNSTGTAIPIPGGVNDTLTNISLNNSPFTVRFTSALGCTAFSAPFAVCLPGTSSANGTLVSLGSPVVFTHNNFVLTQGNDVAWAISTASAGPITSQAQLQTAINNGWVLPATDASSLNLTCADFPGGITNGNYFLTPFTAEALEIDPVFWNANVDSGYCDATFEVCIGLSGSNWEINPLTIILPNGVEIDVIAALAGGLVPPGTPITPTLWSLATSQLGDPACLNLIDIIGYYDNPNGTWQIVIPNAGTGTLNFSINAFDVVVSAASCPEITEDQVTSLPAISGSVQGGTTQTFSILVPPVPASFPTIMSSCNVIGEATPFSINCPLSINDVNNISGFNLYPNPNKGVFNVSFEIFERNDVMIQVYDITGRAILNKNYISRVGSFNEVIEMPYNLSAGFYVVNVIVGDSKLQFNYSP
jgi:hypothetical protein